TDLRSLYDTTHVIGTQKAVQSLNTIFFNHLLFDETCNYPMISECIDTLEFEISNDDHSI
ncbi:15887_t:CDS:1, partial [Entrophospora sp. SA101]